MRVLEKTKDEGSGLIRSDLLRIKPVEIESARSQGILLPTVKCEFGVLFTW